MKEQENQPMSVEYLMSIGLTEEEAKSIHRTQSYEPPSEPEALLRHAKAWSGYEHEMEQLNLGLNQGEINEEQYHLGENEAYNKAMNQENPDLK